MTKEKIYQLAYYSLTTFTVLLFLIIGLYIQSSVIVYTGKLPCADCDGVQTTLTLQGNQTYELHSLYIDKGDPFTEKGTWRKEEKNKMEVYALTSQSHVMAYYKISDNSTITLLNMHANPIKSPFNMTLKKE